jgi:hypothetical protein
MVTVTFDLSAIPKINVTDEYNVISFNFKWSTDPAKIKALTDQKEKSNPGLIAGVTGGVVVAGGIAGYLIWKAMGKNNGGPPDLDTNDLPVHQAKMW